ncbi:GNAT family N-acetyltransferase [Alteribacter natronophilus]|uniref:GNAT family N-acetyltransferase n=1 Tax=Alteribacter natronophilus TaxID=2583810 RepID=UPI00110D2FBD|nr:GNAT family N-acetyltransferase [Alteribacter natronophilus]TMW72108.1 GNAT family N-acetyltransferase [Alteribacter natronophilus]
MSVYVRRYTADDFESLLQIQKEAFPPPFPEDLWWSKEQIEAHVRTFPEGALIAEIDGEPAGSATGLIVRYTDEPHTWEDMAGGGYLTAHDPEGDTLYGIDVCVSPRFRGRGAAGALYSARKELVRELGLSRFTAGCRIPGYHRHAGEMTPEQYMEKVADGTMKDQVLTFAMKNGMTPLYVMRDYLDDEESCNCAVIAEWKPED